MAGSNEASLMTRSVLNRRAVPPFPYVSNDATDDVDEDDDDDET